MELIKPGGCIVNVSAAGLIDPDALAVALESGRVSYAATTLEIEGREADKGDDVRARLEAAGNWKCLRPEFYLAPAIRGRTLRRAIGIIEGCRRGEQPPHLLIDPPLPRMFM